MKIHETILDIKAGKAKDFPGENLPEVAFLGRSNVGKSSLINLFLGRKNLAKTSSTPGKTRALFFYRINKNFYLVDFPGYGYAKVSKSLKTIWGDLIESYLNGRKQLKGLVHIVDIRHAPSVEDKQMAEWLLYNGLPFITVATKADKISRGRYQGNISKIRKELGLSDRQRVIPFSVKNKEGLKEVAAVIAEYIEKQ